MDKRINPSNSFVSYGAKGNQADMNTAINDKYSLQNKLYMGRYIHKKVDSREWADEESVTVDRKGRKFYN